MKSVELSQIDICLWGLLTISINLKEQANKRLNMSPSADRVTVVLEDEEDLAHARDVIKE